MHERTARGWRTFFLVVAVLAAGGVAVAAATLLVGYVWASAAVEQAGELRPTPVERTIVPPPPAAIGMAPDDPLRLEIDLQEGLFEVRPGPPGAPVRVDGQYARGYYDLIEEHVPAGAPGGPAAVIRLRPAHSFLVRLFAGAVGGDDDSHNELTVTIPRELPIDLRLKLRAGESRTDLGGLTLAAADIELAMGEHRLDFGRPLARPLGRMRVDAGMGEIRLRRLGNASPAMLDVSARMGSLIADLGGDWSADVVADLRFAGSMGELRIDVPDDLRIAPDSEVSAVMGDAGGLPPGMAADGAAPHVRLHVSATMGEARIRRYPADVAR